MLKCAVMPAKKKAQTAPRPTRPQMPGYGVPSGTKGLLPWKWAERRLKNSHNYFLSTVRPDGSPHVMPIWGIWFEGAFYFSTGRESVKARNLAAHPRCVVCNELAHEAVIVEGVAVEITPDLKRLGPPYEKKYPGWKLDPNLGPIFRVRPAVAFGMYEEKFQQSATRWKFT